jgi:hypothetical protein
MQTTILPGTMIEASKTFNQFIKKGMVLSVTEVVYHSGKNRQGNLIASTYICKYTDTTLDIKIKLYDFVIEPSGQDDASIYSITEQGWRIKR